MISHVKAPRLIEELLELGQDSLGIKKALYHDSHQIFSDYFTVKEVIQKINC